MAKFVGINTETDTIFPGVNDFPALHPWTTIQKFSQIEIKPNTIVLCDIDDTLLHHPFLNGSWANIINIFFMSKIQADNRVWDAIAAKKLTDEYFTELIKERPFQHTDREGFFALVEKAAKIVFITARFPEAEQFTRENLASIGVDPDLYEIRFSAQKPKGEYIQSEIDLSSYDSVVFIDDQQRNLENVYSYVFHPGLEIYKFDRDKEDPYTYYPFPPGFNPLYRFDGEDLQIRPSQFCEEI